MQIELSAPGNSGYERTFETVAEAREAAAGGETAVRLRDHLRGLRQGVPHPL
jgi:hypothetical protein